MTHERQRWLSRQFEYTKIFDGENHLAAAEAIAARLFFLFLEFSLVEHARYAYACILEHFPFPDPTSRADEPVVVSALTTCLIRWENEMEDSAHPTREEATSVSRELVILALSLLHPTWVMIIPDFPQPASAADEEDERLLAALGYQSDRLALALTENALDATSSRLKGLIRRLATAVRQAVDDELAEALRNLYYPRRLTERQARGLRDQIAEEIRQDAVLSRYFSICRRIEVELEGKTEYHIHLYFDAYGRHYGEMWVQDEKHWRTEADKIRQEVMEEREW